MNVVIAGSRTFEDYELFSNYLLKLSFTITKVISGGAKGTDLLGERWAKENNISIAKFIPDWEKYGKFAGPKRNQIMAQECDAAIVFWDLKSKGSKNMIDEALNLGKIVITIPI